MKLTELRVKNFRCIDSMSINVPNFLSVIGPNNTGKSSILRAVEIFLNQDKPEISEWRKGNEGEPIEIEGTFGDIQDWERNAQGVSGLVQNGEIKLKAIARIEGESVSLSYEAFVSPVEIEGWSEAWGELSATIKNLATGIDLNGTTWRTAANKNRVREIISSQKTELLTHLEPQWTNENISISAALKQALPVAVYVPAVRNASDDGKPGAKTSFGQLLKKIVLPAIQSSDEYRALLSAVTNLSEKLRGTGDNQLDEVKRLGDSLTKRMSSILTASVKFRMDTPDTDKFVGANTGINVDDGTETPIHLQGHGVQRALVFAMIEVLAIQEAARGTDETRSTLLLFEEPEIYLHPHLMRRLRASLMDLSAQDNWQVIITTHSLFFVNVAEDPCSLVITSRISATSAPVHRQLETDPFIQEGGNYDERTALRAAMDFHPTVAEAFFAKKAVLVEGDSELAIFKHSSKIHEKMGISDENHNSTTIVSCGGKWTIPALARVMNAFQISFRIIHDRDRQGRSETELAAAHAIDPHKANEKIFSAAGNSPILVVDDTLENVLWPQAANVSSSDKPFKAWRKIKEIAELANPQDDYPELKRIFDFVYSENTPQVAAP